ncbi:hypothetical protein HBI56_047320 [Parastagonospora nodorum]|nr:hypothetical protein HBH98_073140 [Parastagonospora nodorum]KAH4376528.1 hypothetical protein HBH99_211510 [Parastagonospora nodorum]KAH4391774.1 hypothetical protein HBH97_040790 [Parastagonospora nodorum]KAH5133448.1 hypothetical protein HBH70_153610 [Parastagonospora nodorum]KAH5312292.1 hypothetical protein HBI12_141580 [Parastagonospora nodorum]
MIFKRPDARLKHYRRRHANLSQMAPPKEREVHSNQKEIHEATIERWRSISAEHTGIGGDVGSRSNPAIHINVTKRVPNFLHPEYHKESEADGSISNDDPIYSTVTSQTSDPDEAGMWRTCDSDMDSGTEERVILKKEPEELGTLLNSIGKLHIQCWNNSTHYESHGDGAQDGHHTTTNQNYDIGQEGNNATASQSSAPFKCPIRRKFGEDEDEEDKKGKKRRVKHVPIAGEVMEGLLACPFPKRDPFSYSNCWTYATDNIPHLKQHLKRDHLTPVHCPNCGQLFTGLNSNSEKDRHFIQQTCVQDVTVATRRQGITADQQKQIWRNKPRSMDDDQYWNYIYEVLFASEPPLHPRPEDYVNLGLQLLRQKVTKNFSGLLENRPERADFRLDDLHERTRQDSRSNTPSLPDLLDQAFDIAIVQRHTVTPLLSTFKGCSSGASTHASDSGYASLDTNSAEEDSAPATGHTPQSRASDEAFYPTEDLSCHPEQYREFLEKANHAEGESSTTQVIDYDLYCNPANISKDSDEPVDDISDSFNIDFAKGFQNDLDAGWEFGL